MSDTTLIEARGKARIDFEVGGEEKVIAQIKKLEDTIETTSQKLDKLAQQRELAVNKQVEAEKKLVEAQNNNAAGINVIQKAIADRLKAEAALEKAIIARQKADDKFNSAVAGGPSTGFEHQQLITAMKLEEVAIEGLRQAQLKEQNVRRSNVVIANEELQARDRVVAAKQKVIDITNRENQVYQQHKNAVTQHNAHLDELNGKQTKLNSVFAAGQSVLEGFKSKLSGIFSLNANKSGLTNLAQSVNAAGQAFQGLGATGGRATQLIATGLTQLPTLLISSAGAVGVLTTAFVGLAAVSVSAVQNLHANAFEVRNFANAIGTGAQEASAFSTIAKLVNTNAQGIGISLGYINQNLFGMGNALDNAGAKGAKAIDNIQDKINKLDTDRLQKIGDVWADLAQRLADVDHEIQESVEQLNYSFAEAARDRDREIADANETLQEKLAERNEDSTDRRNDLEDSHADRVFDINERIENAQEDHAETLIERNRRLQERLQDIEQEFANKKISLQERYFTASPLLRPFIAQQIEALGRQEEEERNAAINKEQFELAQLERKFQRQMELLQRQLDRENEAYQKKLARLQQQQDDETAKIYRENEKRLRDIQRRYDDETRSAQRSYDKQLDSYRDQQAKMRREAEDRIRIIEREYLQSLEAIKNKEDEILAGGGVGGVTTPLAAALKELGLNFAELDKMDAAHKLFAIAQALRNYDGLNKTGLINTLAGFFGPTMVNFIDVLGRSGKTFEEFEARMKELAPTLQYTQEELDRIFENQMDWASVGLIVEDLKIAFGKELLPVSEQIVNSIKSWWADDGNRAQALDTVKTIAQKIGEVASTLVDLITGKITVAQALDKIFGAPENAEPSKTVEDAVKGYINSLVTLLIDSATASENISRITKTLERLGSSFAGGVVNGIKNYFAENKLNLADLIFPLNSNEDDPLGIGKLIHGHEVGRTLGDIFWEWGAKTRQFTALLQDENGKQQEAIVKTWLTVENKVYSSLTTYADTTNNRLVQIKRYFDESGREITSKTQTTYKDIETTINTQLTNITADTSNKTTSIKNEWDTNLEQTRIVVASKLANVTDEFTGSTQLIIQNLDSQGEIISTAFVGPIDTALIRLREKRDEWVGLGEDFFSGFRGGFDSQYQSFLLQLPPQIQGLVDASRRGLDSNSPSRKMMVVGDDAAFGLQLGFENRLMNFYGRGVQLATDRLASGIRNSVVNNSNSMSVGSIVVQAASGQSAEEVAQAVYRKLEQVSNLRLR